MSIVSITGGHPGRFVSPNSSLSFDPGLVVTQAVRWSPNSSPRSRPGLVTQADSYPQFVPIVSRPGRWSPRPIRGWSNPNSSRVSRPGWSPSRFDLGGHPIRPRFVSRPRPGWSPRPIRTKSQFVPIVSRHPGRCHPGRFETWVVTQADSSPIRFVVPRPRWSPNFRFETWVVTQSDSSPIRFETWPGWSPRADSYPSNPNSSRSFRDLAGGHPGRFVPESSPNSSPIRFETWPGGSPRPIRTRIQIRFETWVVTQADSYPSPNFDFETWVVTQADSSPIRFVSRPGWSPRPIRYPSIQFVPFRDFLTRWITQAISRPGWSPRPIRPRFVSRFPDLVGHPGRFVPESQISFRDLGGHPGRFVPGSSPV
uniref:Uncharacterized protein n=1 Tax=Fagus sylvatica TaxID=28930 RepID=A0A2N9IKJ1_FAGSY